MKLQFNSLEAIEKLIESDPQFEIQIKEAVLNKLSKSYIKKIENNEVISKIDKMIEDDIYYRDKWVTRIVRDKLNDNVKKLIKSELENQLSEIVIETIEKIIDKLKFELNSKIEQSAEEYCKEIFPEMMAAKFKKEVANYVNKIVQNTKID
jgi:Glu-tRNA(Gln) amidotransferase subunit E-like FAD-binding protein